PKLRTSILSAAKGRPPLAPRQPDELAPILAGWLDDASLPRLLEPSLALAMRTQALLRVPVVVVASPPGAEVLIDGAFNRIMVGPTPGLPYDPSKREWLASSQPGQWLIGFRPPGSIGPLRPHRAMLRAMVSAPQQTV